jgi:hypothetical protein
MSGAVLERRLGTGDAVVIGPRGAAQGHDD